MLHKPSWLNKKINLSCTHSLKKTLRIFGLRTVCEESLCPNISECFNRGVATFMILGDTCTRKCKFCAVKKGTPTRIVEEEPRRIKQAVERLCLRYVVITSPTRDDLPDGGAQSFCRTVSQIKDMDQSIKVEVLIPDFLGNRTILNKIAQCGADVIAHNMETVASLYNKVRSGADYQRSLGVLKQVKEANRGVYTKSGLMLGLGEDKEEVIETLRDLRQVGCDFLTLGQYLAPSRRHWPVNEYVSPKKFRYFEKVASYLGFKKLKSSPYVRSSYLAHTFL
ncbi:MAG: lipoyl synthase [Candidatus Omnitrophota bacterium]|nr:MAG: lipoyl synthase [Candidatus Omnitrophota bacterium]